MSRRVERAVPVEVAPDGSPVAFTYHGITYRVRVIGHWRLRDKWWSPSEHSIREYYRVEATDHEVFELYRDDAKHPPFWVLDIIQD